MLEGWYCRTLASQRASGQQEDQNVNVDDDSGSDDQTPQNRAPSANENNTNNTNGDQVDYKAQYRYLKRKLKFLIYENEFFQDALRSNQRRLLKVSRDRAFLLDRLLQYEKPDDTSESDVTESSEDEATKEAKKRKPETSASGNSATASGSTRGRKRKAQLLEGPQQKIVNVDKNTTETHAIMQHNNQPQQQTNPAQALNQTHHEQQQQQQLQQPHLTSYADVERHLRQTSRPNVMELMPEHASATVPTEMFSNDPSLDGEPQEQLMDSPSHVAAEECVTMEYTN